MIPPHILYLSPKAVHSRKKSNTRSSVSQKWPQWEENLRLSLGLYYHSLHAPPPCFLFLGSIGGESLAVAQNTYAVNWFKGKELNLVFGLQLSMARLVRRLLTEYQIIMLSNNMLMLFSKQQHYTVFLPYEAEIWHRGQMCVWMHECLDAYRYVVEAIGNLRTAANGGK